MTPEGGTAPASRRDRAQRDGRAGGDGRGVVGKQVVPARRPQLVAAGAHLGPHRLGDVGGVERHGVAQLQRRRVGDGDRSAPARVAAVGRSGDVALQRQQQAPALARVPRRVADVVEALRGQVAGQRVGVRRVLAQVAIGAVQADRDAVEEPLPGGRVGEALEVGERHAVGLGQAPATGIRAGGGTRHRKRGGQCGAHGESGQATADADSPRRATQISSAGQRRAHSAVTYSWRELAPSGACSSCSASTVKPQRPSSAIARRGAGGTRQSRRSTRSGACRTAARERLARGLVLVVHREHHQRRVGEEPQPAAGSQEARRLGDPRLGIAPQAGAVLGDREVERVGGQRHRLGAALDEREVQAVLGLQRVGGRELFRSHVDADRSGAAARQPRRHVGGPAAELDHVAPIDLGQRADALLGDLPVAPGDRVVRPVPAPGRGVVAGQAPQATRLARACSLRLTPTERRGPGGSSWGA